MEPNNAERERRVWQRVTQSNPEAGAHRDLYPVLQMSAQMAAAYRDLAKFTSGKEKDSLLFLMEGEKSNIAAMKGILVFSGNPVPEIRYPTTPREPRSRTLARCVHCARETYLAYASRLAEPDFGPAFQVLANREQKQLELTLALLGESPVL